MAAPPQLLNLVRRFERGLPAFHSASYNETQVRNDFIDPLFGLLGWDMDNESGAPEHVRDVVHEDAIRIGRRHRAPDYGFRVGGQRRFFVEAKRPSVRLQESKAPAFQLRRYAWSAKLPLSILTDFEEFAVYDCRVQPKFEDTPEVARIRFSQFQRYEDQWDEIYALFSKEAVLGGSLTAFAEAHASPRGSATVDAAFLKQIESWRAALARNLLARNPDLTQRELNYAVQMTVDRIIFLRMVEDRGIEEYGRLESLLEGSNVYERLLEFYRRADERYNSGLFHFRREQGRSDPPDDLTPSLTIDDEVLQSICRSLYYPQSPYEFSVLPAEILGQVYEQFLGKVIVIGSDRRVSVEVRPEVKKAGGVYYTPAYIVRHIVERALRPLLASFTPRSRGRDGKLRIVDPACGSGSFLIGAYQYLLDWHLDQYMADGPDKHRGVLYQGQGGHWRLTTQEKKRILLESIFGVDIDSQAVEVTKLSLLLKVLESETEESLSAQLRLFQERALPDLENNIKCGNSLIGPDFYGHQQANFLEDETHLQINVFDWYEAFPAVFRDGGFDAVIGNLNIDDTWGKGDQRQRYIKRAYAPVYNDKTDVLFYFLAKAVQVGKGEFGFIVSRAFLEAFKADKLRRWLAEHTDVREITDFRDYSVFDGVGITTAVVSLTKRESVSTADVYQLKSSRFLPEKLGPQLGEPSLFQHVRVDQDQFGPGRWSFATNDVERINGKIDSTGQPLSDVLLVGQGMQTGRNNIFGKLTIEQIEEWGLVSGQYFRRARNSDIQRYRINESGEMIVYVEDFDRFDDLPVGLQRHFLAHESELKSRAAYQRGNCEWWRFTWPLHKDEMRRPKLLCPYLAASNRFALDECENFLGLTDTTVLYDAGQPEDLRYMLGLLNSKLLTFRFRYIGKLKSGGILEYFWNSLSELPIRRVQFSSPTSRERHDVLVALVTQLEVLQGVSKLARIAHERIVLQHRIAALERQIDAVVYKLYGLTADEIKIVEKTLEGEDLDQSIVFPKSMEDDLVLTSEPARSAKSGTLSRDEQVELIADLYGVVTSPDIPGDAAAIGDA